MIIVDFKKTTEKAIVPTQGSKFAAGYDLYVVLTDEGLPPFEDDCYILAPGATHKFHTGIAVELPPGYYASVRSRSGMSWSNNIEVVGGSGTIDSDYRNEIYVPLRNMSDCYVKIYEGQRIAQLIIQKHETVQWKEVDELHPSDRGMGGFGSTGA